MGSSKKHKSDKYRDQKRKRHRSRSRSRSYSPERDRIDKHRHHKKHKKKERKDYDSDVEIISAPPPPKISKNLYLSTPSPPEISNVRKYSPTPPKNNQSQATLSIEETNILRAKLGLKPLDVSSAPKSDDKNLIKDDLGEFYHKPAVNASDKQKSQKIKEKITTIKEKRQIETSLNAVKPLGESDSDDDVSEWVKKNRKLVAEKKKAEETAKMLDQFDEQFGIGNLVNEELHNELNKAYTEKDLKGLRVEHEIDNFREGNTVILTLKDQPVLAKESDVLVNVNMIDDERYKKNVLIKSKKPGYDAYDESNFDEYGLPINQILSKYDEEIEGEKKDSFSIGSINFKELKEKQANLVKARLANKRIETLEMPELKLAQDYYNEEELVKFKKPKKKIRKIRKNKPFKADDITPDHKDYLRDLGSRRRRSDNNDMETNDIDIPNNDLGRIQIEEDDGILEKKIKQKTLKLKKPMLLSKPENIAIAIQQESENSNEINHSGTITLNSMAEFCRTLGDIPTYGSAGNREDNMQEFMEFEEEEEKREQTDEDEDFDGRGAWNTVKEDIILKEPIKMEAAILDAEPSIDKGVGGALKLAMSKGYLQKDEDKRPSASRFAHLKAQHYSIEDKTYGDDEKFGRRDRFNGPTSDFKEKDGYKPNVKLEYIDDDGHILCAKEAFRYLSHKFHGKGPGKNKVEKRMKKAEQEILMKRMSSTDTPLGTLTLLQAKQKDTQSPFIVLSGSKQMQTASISKSKH